MDLNVLMFQPPFFYLEEEDLYVCSVCAGKIGRIAKNENVALSKNMETYQRKQKEQLNSCLHIIFGQVYLYIFFNRDKILYLYD